MSQEFSREHAGKWFLESGIQQASGGTARYYMADEGRYRAVSTEITGYAAATLAYLYRITKREIYLERARRTASFLCDHAWDSALRVFPFEHPSPTGESDHLTYFFDSGIIIRGLLAVWRVTREDRLLERAIEGARGMTEVFRCEDGYHPILGLPGKRALDRACSWSRNPGCYQAKSALAWRELAEITGERSMEEAYLGVVAAALRSHHGFVAGARDRAGTMDRLHAYCYFLEALTPLLGRADCAEAYHIGLERVARVLREIRGEFVRSDVYAQLLRARLFGAPVMPVNREQADEEARELVRFQGASKDARIDGGFYFGARAGDTIAHVNPVSTSFAIQALEMWRTGSRDCTPI